MCNDYLTQDHNPLHSVAATVGDDTPTGVDQCL